MAESFYAWSNILHDDISIQRGSKLSLKDLPGLKQAEWDAMVEAGAIRNRPFPAPSDYAGSAIDYLKEQLAESQAAYAPIDEEEAASELAEVQKEAEEKPAAPVSPAPSAKK